MYATCSQHPYRNRLARTWIALLLCLVASMAQATSQTTDEHTTWTANRSLEATDNGLIYSLPIVNQQQLASEIRVLHRQLKQRREVLSNMIEENSFTAADALIVAALPGGFLYAAVKKQRTQQAERELDSVTSQLDGLAGFRPLNTTPLNQPAIAAR